MTFEEALAQLSEALQKEHRISYRALKRRFDLEDDLLEDLKEELIYAKHLATDEDNRVLVWSGKALSTSDAANALSQAGHQAIVHNTPPVQEKAPAPVSPTPEAERRQLTVMFCDLVESTKLSAQLDPEDLREVVRAYQERAAGVIQQYEGHIAQYLGDGLLVYFGWPRAHEDDAHRAVHSGLGMVEAVDDLNTTLTTTHGVQLAVRVGIHTGSVVVGEMGGGGRHENLALGETPNIAARLEGLAPPGTVVISEATRRLVAGAFNYDDLGRQDLKGISEAIPVFRLRGVSAAASRFEATTTTLTPIVGREVEVDLMMRCWEHALEGEGQVVLLNGPPGIGKSRLLQALCDRLADTPHVRLRYQCSPYHTNSALYPIATQVTHAMQLPPDASAGEKLERLEGLVAQTSLPVEEAVILFATMLSIRTDDRYPSLALTPQRQKERTLELFAQGLVNLSRQDPVLFLFEDVHWSDPTSIEALSLVIDQVQDARVLVVLTYRPEFEPAWRDQGHVTTYTLNRLSRRQTLGLIEHITGGKELPAKVLDQIAAKTDGIPLFVEELTKHVLESEWLSDDGERYRLTSPLSPLAIPATLQDSLMARLDRLAEVKEVVQLGAAIGREFSYALLRAVAPLSDRELQDALGQLIDAELVSQRGLGLETTYSFKHALIQDTAYQSMLRTTRQQVHQQIAQVLEAQFPETAAAQPELVAQHYTEAGCYEEAVSLWRVAGGIAAKAKSAYQEAMNHFGQALDALEHLPESCAVLEQAIDLRLELRSALLPLEDIDRMLGILREAETLAIKLDDPRRLARVTANLTHCLWQGADLDQALTTGQRALALASAIQDEEISSRVNGNIARVYFSLGQFGKAIETFGLILGDVNLRAEGVVHNSRWLAKSYAELGAFTEGRVSAAKSIRMAEETSQPYLLASAYTGPGYLCLCQGDLSMATSSYRRGLDVCQRWHINQLMPGHALGLSLALSLAGQAAEALTLLEQTIDQHGFTGLLVYPDPVVPRLGEIYLLAGRLEEAMSYTQQQLEFAVSHGEVGRQAWSFRLLGEIVVRQESQNCELAESYYDQSLTLANELGMRALQGHCHHGLGTLYRQTGQVEKARAELSTAIEMYRDMEMTFWLPETEATLAKVQ